MIKVAPSLLTADFGHLADAVKTLDRAGADWIHCDVMDNVFVPNMSFGQPMIAAFRRATAKPLDVHLMLVDSLKYIEEFAEAGADIITVHAESPSSVHLQRVVRRIKDCGKLAGVAVNPATPPEALEYVYEDIDLALLMSVNPGYGAQRFIPQVLRKIEHVAGRIARLNVKVEVEVDGGITSENCAGVRAAGATVLVAGHAVLDAPDPAAAIRILKGASA